MQVVKLALYLELKCLYGYIFVIQYHIFYILISRLKQVNAIITQSNINRL